MSQGTDIPLSPEESFHASKMFGNSLFSAMQLNKELEKLRKARAERKFPHDDILRIPLPGEMLQPQKQAADDSNGAGILGRALKLNSHPIRMLVGGQSGFEDAQRDFHEQEKAHIAKELAAAQKEYLDVLQRIKTGEETPYVDAFCEGIALQNTYEKEAADTAEDINISDHAMHRLLGDTLNFAKKPFQPMTDTAARGLVGSSTSAAYLTYLLRKKLREEPDDYLNEDMPTRVELVPYQHGH